MEGQLFDQLGRCWPRQSLTNDLDITLLELRSQAGDLAELSGADLMSKEGK